jgi:hypothetical protein
MLGSLLAGTKNLRRNYYFEGRKFKSYRWDLSNNGRWFKRPLFQDVEDDVKKWFRRL